MRMNGVGNGINMDLIEQLEVLRISDSDFFDAYDTQYWEYLGKNEMLDDCLEIVWKWLQKKGYLND